VKLSKGAAKRAKKAQQQLQQQGEIQEAQTSTIIITPSESPAPEHEDTQNPVPLSKAAAKRAKKAEKAPQRSREETEQAQTTPIFTPSESPAPEPEASGNPETLSKGALKRAKKAEKALRKLQEQQDKEAQQVETSTSSLTPGQESLLEATTSHNPVQQSKGAAKRARKAERALQQLQKQEGREAEVQQPPAPAPINSKNTNAAPTALPETVLEWGDEPADHVAATPEKPVKNAKQPKKEKKEKKEKGKKKKQTPLILENGKVGFIMQVYTFLLNGINNCRSFKMATFWIGLKTTIPLKRLLGRHPQIQKCKVSLSNVF
jgi:hypothetical protein